MGADAMDDRVATPKASPAPARGEGGGGVYQVGSVSVEFPNTPSGTELAFMGHVISTLDRAGRHGRPHALLQSPAGRGNSLALLCSALAWQRHYPLRAPPADPGETHQQTPGDPEEVAKKKSAPTIYYAMKTHSQITQLVEELRNTTYRPHMAILASRKHYIVNKNVCMSDKIDEQWAAQKLSRHPSLEIGGCNEVHDTEDLIRVGKQVKGCPYFAAQTMAEPAQLVFCPYGYLISPIVRRAMDIDIRGSVVILDEAHDIEDMSRDAGSVYIDKTSLGSLGEELARLATDVDASIYQPLHAVIEGLSKWLTDQQGNLHDNEFEHPGWTGENAVKELQRAGITPANLPVSQDRATQAIKAASYADSDGGHLNGRDATTLESLFSSLSHFFSGNGHHMYNYKLAFQQFVHGEGNSSIGSRCVMSLCCLTPAVIFHDLADLAHSVILTSGTLSPMSSFASELGVQFDAYMEAPHVIDADSQAGDSSDAEVKPTGGILFVEKLSPKTQDTTLGESFSRFGTVISAKIARDLKNGDSLRYGFIEFLTKETCEHAEMMMDHTIIDGREIRVSLSNHQFRESKLNTNKVDALIVATKKKATWTGRKGNIEAAGEVALPNCSIPKRKFDDADKGAYAEEQAHLGGEEADEAAETKAKQPRMEGNDNLPDEYVVSESELDSAFRRREKDYRIGAGSFGTVLRLKLKGETVAVKYLNDTSAEPKEEARSLRAFDAEVLVLSKLKHCNLVRLIGVCKEYRAIIYEFLPHGSLFDRMLLCGKKFSWRQRIDVALDVCSGLQYLQDRTDPIVHGDIAPTNILFDESNVAKLGDFGISRILLTTSQSGRRVHATNNTPTGTPYYVDPEYTSTGILSKESDIFALGVILMQLVSGNSAEGLTEKVHQALASDLFWKTDQGPEDKQHLANTLLKVQLIDKNIKLPDIIDGLELLKVGRDCTWQSRKMRLSLEQIVDKLRSLRARSTIVQVKALNVSQT